MTRKMNDLRGKVAKAIQDYLTIRSKSSWIFGRVNLEAVSLMMMNKIDTLQSESAKLEPTFRRSPENRPANMVGKR
jgi:hypothetical protein